MAEAGDKRSALASGVRLFFVTVINLAALTAAVFTILAWIDAQFAREQANVDSETAKEQADAANLIAFAAACAGLARQSVTDGNLFTLCSLAGPSAESSLLLLAQSLFSTTFRTESTVTTHTTTYMMTITSASATTTYGATSTLRITSATTPDAAPTPSATNSQVSPTVGAGPGARGLHLSENYKIAIGVGLGIGLPSLLMAIFSLVFLVPRGLL
ncbi:hypothetical protein BAUCODRAFT_218919 [Baudoinia panamericana UAMH 10762]|uniref:Uncharacterized protein n=1 Tax=Baudoinia panamericana (strain UAMH 10762) TaxID=717646 RepID=M2N5K1_BAUPA|nr:uncharacterized protein BAUCODRAFT_218919 [Baudoinia panamericana UAMH 10762]EMC94025.1 hypothetical protein BAUCODRAFT_218919 [Baudoinia panamericana UAMH 10762]